MENKTIHPILPEKNKDPKKTLLQEIKGPKVEIPRKPHPKNSKQIINFIGNIKEWVYNNDYIYDGFILQTETENLLVKFPPHLGNLIMTSAESNSDIILKGVVDISPMGEKTIRFISMQSGEQIVDDIPPSHQPIPEVFTREEGEICNFQYDPKGNICGYIVDNQYLLKIPPHISEELKNQIQPGIHIRFTGMVKANKEGEVKAENFIILHMRTLSINGIEYSIK